ncbi:MAG TPA: RidA family protein [Pseudonocardia sp.]|nr:RidA family protein [Pseudonocardia sp.]
MTTAEENTVQRINPESLPVNPAFSQVVRVPAGMDTIHVGGQNGVGPDGAVVGPGVAEQARQAFANLRACLEAAGAQLIDVVKWTILVVDGAPIQEGFAVFGEVWPRRAAPPAITVAVVAGLAVPGALVEVEAVAAVHPGRA